MCGPAGGEPSGPHSHFRAVPNQDYGRRKVIDHPGVGRITLDCDTLIVAADDVRVMIYTAEPDTSDAERLSLAIVLVTQALVD
ncbi:MmyB family transcriptional regulator [Mycolicibacterium sphagni]|uniref:MmyB family transcriptional regulator n=1 Tax=Mycolicibacterium sphagni TaxID=1786 RepID=UPI0021F39AFF|nr:hypothetical protein [Mycolicibacterium sphagni]MCV7178284.1 hypothetical protein [Mycolicibacterium sphagni]